MGGLAAAGRSLPRDAARAPAHPRHRRPSTAWRGAAEPDFPHADEPDVRTR